MLPIPWVSMTRSLHDGAIVVSFAALVLASCSSLRRTPDDGDVASADGDGDGDIDVDADADGDGDSDADTDGDDDSIDLPEGPFGEVAPVCWVTHFGGDAWFQVSDQTVLADGTIVIAGEFSSGTITFGAGEANETTLEYVTTEDVGVGFLARFDADGALLWARRVDVVGEGPLISSISALRSGDFFIMGCFVGSATFGSGEVSEATMTSAGQEDFYLARYRADGSLVWARRDGGEERDVGLAMAALPDESCIVVGTYNSRAVFGSDKEGETWLESPRGTSGFIARYLPYAELSWVRNEGGYAFGREVAVSEGGSFAITGSGNFEAVVGQGQPNETRLECGLDCISVIFLALYDDSGLLQWARAGETPFFDANPSTSVAFDDGSFAMTGSLFDSLTFRDGDGSEVVLNSPTTESSSQAAMFAARYDTAGAFEWAIGTRAALGNPVSSSGSAALPGGGLLVTGTYSRAAFFGEGSLEDTLLISSGENEPYVAEYGPTGSLRWLARVGRHWEDSGATAMDGLDDGSFILSGMFTDQAEFLLESGEYLMIEAMGDRDGFLLRLCP